MKKRVGSLFQFAAAVEGEDPVHDRLKALHEDIAGRIDGVELAAHPVLAVDPGDQALEVDVENARCAIIEQDDARSVALKGIANAGNIGGG